MKTVHISRTIIVCSLLLVASGCKKQNGTWFARKTEPVTEQPKGLVYQEDVGAYVLTDEAENPLMPTAQESRDLVLVKPEDYERDSASYGFERIYFDFDKFGIRADQKPILEKDARLATELAGKGYEILIHGHSCDSAGSEDYNILLSEKRARSVADAFKKLGVPQTALKTTGLGSSYKLVASGDQNDQAPNRRVEIYVSKV